MIEKIAYVIVVNDNFYLSEISELEHMCVSELFHSAAFWSKKETAEDVANDYREKYAPDYDFTVRTVALLA